VTVVLYTVNLWEGKNSMSLVSLLPTNEKDNFPRSDEGESITSFISRAGRFHRKPVSFWGLVALIFFSVSGGPFGSEPSVANGGPFWAIVGFIVFPIIWCVPEALVTSELSSLFPGNSGFTTWVGGSFGSPFLGYIEGFCSFASTVTNCSVYPRLFASNLEQQFAMLADPIVAPACMLGFIFVNGYVTFRGLHIIGGMGIVLLMTVLAPFILLIVFGLPQIEFSNTLIGSDTIPAPHNLLGLFNVLFWNLNNWDAISTLAGEVQNPRSLIPKAMSASLTLIAVAYVLPLVIGAGMMHPGESMSNWQPGYFQEVANRVSGPWLSSWILLAAMLASVGQFQSLLSSCAYQIEGMASMGWLPEVFRKRTIHGTPVVGIAIAISSVTLLIQLSFIRILEYLNIIYCVAMLLEFAAFLNMRFRYSTIHAPFRIPLGVFWCTIMLIPPTACIVAIVGLPIFTRRYDIMAVCACTILAGIVSYWLIETARERKWMKFVMKPPTDFHHAVRLHESARMSNDS
jgi:amino acid transporter